MKSPYTTELQQVYGAGLPDGTIARLSALIDRHRGRIRAPASTGLSERDSILITYPDLLREEGQWPLQAPADFCDAKLRDLISGIHILPFFRRHRMMASR